MTTPQKPACACPKTDARYCLEWRTKDDMGTMLGDPSALEDDEVCVCYCHNVDDGDYDDV